MVFVAKPIVLSPLDGISFHSIQGKVDGFEVAAGIGKAKEAGGGVTMQLHLNCEGEHYIYFNETKLQRIIDNNITNAIKYTLPSEQIHIQTYLKGTHICFEIYSRSKKIEDINKVLEPYYRENKKMDGFGLGLNLVKSICDEEDVAFTIDSSDDVTRFSYSFTVMGV